MWAHNNLTDSEMRTLLRSGKIQAAGNQQLKIYGTLRCGSGKRMKRSNRLFFSSFEEAKQNGFRPCGHCCKDLYHAWKIGDKTG